MTQATGQALANLLDQGVALHQQGHLAQAKAIYEQVLQQQANQFDALHLLGVLLHQTKHSAAAVDLLKRAIAMNPQEPAPRNNLGIVLNELGRFEEALAHYDTLLRTQPGHAQAWFNRGITLKGLGRLEEAVASFGQATTLQPGYAEAWNNRGVVLQTLGRFDEALGNFDKAIALQSDFASAWNNRGTVLQKLKRPEEALTSFSRATDLQPGFAAAWYNRGLALLQLLRPGQALGDFEAAIALNAHSAETWLHHGFALWALRRMEDAIASFGKTIDLDPDNMDAHWNQALALLMTGQFQKGWAMYEWRWKTPQAQDHVRNFTQPLWLGAEPLKGKTILLHAEQGLGDAIQFCRYASRVRDMGAKVLLEVPAALTGLLQTLDGPIAVLEADKPLPAFDLHCPLLSLPLAFQTELHTIPQPAAYLKSDANKRKAWETRLAAQTGIQRSAKRGTKGVTKGPKTRPRIGLVWSGKATHNHDHQRSLTLQNLVQHLPQGCDYISLQKELRAADQDALQHSGILYFGDELHDFADTAALCDLMDLVISVDTSVAHLAGALGKPTWVLLPFVPDWRWLLDRDDSPWYPSVTLYRQAADQQWAGVLEQVSTHLRRRLGLANAAPLGQQPPATQALTQPALFSQHTAPEPTPAPATATAQELAALLDQALALHQQGQLAQAKPIYGQILQQQPTHFDALHLLGMVLCQMKDPGQALPLLDRALAARPQNPTIWNNRGVALNDLERFEDALENYNALTAAHPGHADAWFNRALTLKKLGRLEDAVASYDTAIAIQGDNAQTWNNRGVVLRQLKRLEEALTSHERAIALKPDFAVAHNNRGIALQELQRPEDALTAYAEALALNPGYADAWFNQGVSQQALQRLDQALASYDRLLSINPGHAQAHLNCGIALKELGRMEEALAHCDHAVQSRADFVEAWNFRGIVLQALLRREDALASYDRILAIAPNHAEAWNNRGVNLLDMDRLPEAKASLQRATEAQSDYAQAWFNLSIAHKELGDLEASIAACEQAIRIKPDYVEALLNQSLALLALGQFSRGWPLYEWRWKNEKSDLQPRPFAQPLWLGAEPLAGKTILLHSEQGLGDTIQFCRYAKAVSDLGATVLLAPHAPLTALLQTLQGVHTLVEDGQPMPAWDLHCPLLSLPLAFQTDLHNIPGDGPYLASDANKRQAWSKILGAKTTPRIGLVWSGSTVHKGDRQRSLSLAHLLHHLPAGFDYISLQKEIRAVDQDTLQGSGIRHFGDQLHDFTDTAALCDLMDLVISVDTSVAHLAGALGKTTWILLPFVADWRWLQDRTDSPWYASVTLYRQAQDRQWAPVLQRVGHDIVQHLAP